MSKHHTLLTIALTGIFLMASLISAEAPPEPLPPGALARFGNFRGREPSRKHQRSCCLPAHNLLATAGHDDVVHLYDLTTGRRLRSLAIDDQSAGPMAFAPDGKTIVVECRADLCLFDVSTGKEKGRLTGHGSRIDGLAFSPDGKWLASCEGKAGIRVWDMTTGKLHRHINPPDRYQRGVAFAPDNRTLAVVNDTEKHDEVRCWDIASGEEGKCFLAGMLIGGLAFSPDGKRLAVSGDELAVLDLASGKMLWHNDFAETNNHQRRLCRVAFSPDGKEVATATATTIHRVKVEDGRALHTFTARASNIKTDSDGLNMITLLAYSGDGTDLYSWGCGDRLRIWDAGTGRQKLSLEGHQGTVVSVRFSPDGKRVISTAEDDHARLWNAETGKALGDGTGVGEPLPLADNYHLAYSPDGQFLVGIKANRENRIKVWRTGTMKEIGEFLADKDVRYAPLLPTSFAVTQPRLAVLESSGQILVFEVKETLERLHTIVPPENRLCHQVVISPDGALLAGIVGRDTICIWETATGREVRTFTTGLSGDLSCLAFSPDNRSLVSGGEHTSVRLWEVASGQLRCQWRGHQHWVTAVAFSPDGRRLLSGSADWTLMTWDAAAPPGKLVLTDPAEGWKELSCEDAEKAFWTICQMTRLPGTLPLLREQVREMIKKGGPQIGKLIRQLDNDSFEEREKATEELEKLGKDAEEAMRKALAGKPSPEMKQRLERLLEAIQPGAPAPGRMRWVRAVEVLERIGTPEARDLLREAARPDTGGWLPEAAREAVRRMDRVPTKP
jgi:WD40 repeat protein